MKPTSTTSTHAIVLLALATIATPADASPLKTQDPQ